MKDQCGINHDIIMYSYSVGIQSPLIKNFGFDSCCCITACAASKRELQM